MLDHSTFFALVTRLEKSFCKMFLNFFSIFKLNLAPKDDVIANKGWQNLYPESGIFR